MPDKETSTHTGYSQEDEHFKRKELEWLQAKRTQLDAAREAQTTRQRAQTHWMKCPKCGGDLNEVPMDGVKVDKCSGCGGVFLDSGELEILTRKSGGFLKKMFG